MNFYSLDLVIDETLKNELSNNQKLLKQFTGKNFEKKEAEYLWSRITDHKWYVSERLQRDVGFKVAALDFMENFYQPLKNYRRTSNFSDFFQIILRPFKSFINLYLAVKSNQTF